MAVSSISSFLDSSKNAYIRPSALILLLWLILIYITYQQHWIWVSPINSIEYGCFCPTLFTPKILSLRYTHSMTISSMHSSSFKWHCSLGLQAFVLQYSTWEMRSVVEIAVGFRIYIKVSGIATSVVLINLDHIVMEATLDRKQGPRRYHNKLINCRFELIQTNSTAKDHMFI